MRRTPSPKHCTSPIRSSRMVDLSANRHRSGGVSIVGTNGKIDINNTFDERLKLLESDALPMVRTSLFGKNENRKFYD